MRLDEERWRRLGMHWRLRPDTTYLNHGSFGPPPEEVRQARLRLAEELDRQPMDFFVRRFEPAWRAARARLARFIGAPEEDLVFVENATMAMNTVAASFPLGAGDEVLLTDHEYGAVGRIWERAARARGAVVKTARLPLPFRDTDETLHALFADATERTRLVVASHVTSSTAVRLPIAGIGARARERGIALCVDGPHAPVQVPLDVAAIGCDFYTASCHKWLSAPFGSGFLYVAPPRQAQVRPPLLSWGRLLPKVPESWSEEFCWSGTRDPSPFLTVPAAIDFMERAGLEFFRSGSHELARHARLRLVELTRLDAIVPDSPDWYGSMALVPLPPGDPYALQSALWERGGIEVPITLWGGARHIRVSCHFYNDRSQIDRLVALLGTLLREGR
jgi:isopenicillin-N epimerase